MARLNKDREQKLQPVRIEYALSELAKLGISPIYETDIRIDFMYKEAKIMLYPYSGWFTGKTVIDGRGIEKLLKQLNNN